MNARPLLAALVTGLSFATIAPAQAAAPDPAPAPAAAPDFSKTQIVTHDLGNKTYMLVGTGGNMTVAVGSDAVFLVDTEYAPLHDKIKAAIAAVSDKPVKYALNTHLHGDHSGGDAPFAKEGTTVIAHRNVRKRLAAGTTNALTGAKTPPVSGDALPSKTYGEQLTIDYGQRKVEIRHPHNAHTDGDSYAWFADANVLATGDIVTVGGRYPNIDVGSGGSIQGMIQGVETYMKISNDETKIVPGHGPLLTRAQLATYLTLLQTAEARVQALVKEGKSEDETVAAHPLMTLDAAAGANAQASDNFVRLIYRSLKKH